MSFVIKAENLSKSYELGVIGTGSLVQDLQRWIDRVRGKEDTFKKITESYHSTDNIKSKTVWSLKNVSFEIEQGDIVGIIGANGAGKSTLLKLLSRVTSPTAGRIIGKGRIASLLEVGTGFHGELTGRENIYLNGAIMGMRKKAIKNKFDEIVAFSGVEKYIDTPVKRYSSGMYVRLAFSVAAYLDAEILILDEILAVGDADFQNKCLKKIEEVAVHQGKTVLFVSHDLNAVSQLCKKGFLLSRGQILTTGRISSVISAYLSHNYRSPVYINEATIIKHAFIRSIKVVNEDKQVTSVFSTNQDIYLDMNIGILQPSSTCNMFIVILDSKKRRVFACESPAIQENMTLMIRSKCLVRGEYSLTALIHTPEVHAIDWIEDVCNFRIFDTGSYLVKHGEYDYGVVFGNYEWK